MSTHALADFKPIRALEIQGWRVAKTGQGHYRAAPPDTGKAVCHFSTSSEPRAFKNTVAQLRRSGLVWPPPRRVTRERNPKTEDEMIDAEPLEAEAFAVPEPEPEPEPEPIEEAPKENEEQRLERIWAELKSAKVYVSMADEELRSAEQALVAAQEKFNAARAELERAKVDMADRKAAFDGAFEASR